MTEHSTVPEPSLQREIVLRRRDAPITRIALLAWIAAFSTVSALAGMGVSALVLPARASPPSPSTMTVIRRPPVVIPCPDPPAEIGRAKLLFIETLDTAGDEIVNVNVDVDVGRDAEVEVEVEFETAADTEADAERRTR